MNALDDVLDVAAADLLRAISRVPVTVGHQMATVAPFGTPPRPGHRRLVLVVAAGVVAAVGVGGLVVIERHSAVQPATVDVTTSTTPIFDEAHRPLELARAPSGYALAGRGVRPAGGEIVRSAVFVRRDAAGAVSSKIVVRLGHVSLVGPAGTSTTELLRQPVTPPANLPTATAGRVVIQRTERVIHVEYDLGTLGGLTLDAHHLDAQTDSIAAQRVEQIAAALSVVEGQDISVTGPLPDGWQLATAGIEPENATPNFFQAFEVDAPDGGAKIMIGNVATTDDGFPYWAMGDTLEPLVIRGHDGYASTDSEPSGITLIWPESPGHWVTIRADLPEQQLVTLANELTPMSPEAWQSSDPTTTTTTEGPVLRGSSPAGETGSTQNGRAGDSHPGAGG
jgi:hypothetical protein